MKINSMISRSQVLRTGIWLVLVLANLIPALLALSFIRLYGVNTLVLDDLAFVEMFDKLRQGKLCLA